MVEVSSSTEDRPGWYAVVGLTLACLAGFFVGMSLILQKKGLMACREQAIKLGRPVSYVTNWVWWMGMLCMALGEVSNFGAYAFSPAILVTPLYAVSVVVSAIMSVVLLKESMNFSGSMGIILCIIGSTLIVLHSPHTTTVETLPDFFRYVLAPGFLTYSGFCAILSLWLVFKVGPRYGHVNPIVYLATTALGGAYLVNSAQGLGAAIVYSITHWNTDNQFSLWSMYPLIVFVVLTVLFQVRYLNMALDHFSTSIVTPLNYVFFSTATLVTSAVLYQGFNVSSAIEAVTILMGFFVIVIGVALLFQYNLKLNKLAQVKWIEDINDEEENEANEEQSPLQLMRDVFPFNPEGRVSHLEPEKDQYMRDGPDQVVISSTAISPEAMVPQVPLTEQIQHQLKPTPYEYGLGLVQDPIEKQDTQEEMQQETQDEMHQENVGKIETDDETSSYSESVVDPTDKPRHPVPMPPRRGLPPIN
ncbi:magnesium transporter NIPA-domain-containing protein [Gorgonomyces haynaldii]|nr:magnesium transporter NIPA-domain-containing protein [Gorgonomyces haynaldii]